MRRLPLFTTSEEAEVTADEFETLDALQAELWISRRFTDFVESGFPPDLSLLFAVHPDVQVPDGSGANTDANPAFGTAA
jgi:hypothetical protein